MLVTFYLFVFPKMFFRRRKTEVLLVQRHGLTGTEGHRSSHGCLIYVTCSGLWAPWSSERYPCLWQGWTRWSLKCPFQPKSFYSSMIYWFVRKDLSKGSFISQVSLGLWVHVKLEFALSSFNYCILGWQGHPFSQ